jgi:hypothetical protein
MNLSVLRIMYVCEYVHTLNFPISFDYICLCHTVLHVSSNIVSSFTQIEPGSPCGYY